ncbi:hypothetical protein D349_00023 [Enterococcus faecalis UP2S-6]|nr:hypothetical protein D349_00023 [Enterococcus faecalis UP2S-6]
MLRNKIKLSKEPTGYTLLDFLYVHDILEFLRGQQSWATEF